MGKKIRVIIKTDKLMQYKKGNIINVSAGYAFNYLIPKNMAEIATCKKIKHFSMFSIIEEKKQKANFIAKEKLKNKIIQVEKIVIYKKKGENYLVFGSIKEKDISDWIKKYSHIELNNKQIKLNNNNTIGINSTNIQIKPDIAIKVKLYNLPNNI